MEGRARFALKQDLMLLFTSITSGCTLATLPDLSSSLRLLKLGLCLAHSTNQTAEDLAHTNKSPFCLCIERFFPCLNQTYGEVKGVRQTEFQIKQ